MIRTFKPLKSLLQQGIDQLQ